MWYEGLTSVTLDSDLNDEYWDQLLAVRAEVNKVIESARREKLIGGSLEAEITLYADEALSTVLNTLGDELRFVLLTSKTDVVALSQAPADAIDTELATLKLGLKKSEAEKCERCWHHREDVGQVVEHPTLCTRCVTNIEGEGETRQFA
jgi:isoleucyl-tRNA synthetase